MNQPTNRANVNSFRHVRTFVGGWRGYAENPVPVDGHREQEVGAGSKETARYWNAIVGNRGEECMCGWCKDKWGTSWQITPRVLVDSLGDPDRVAAKRAFEAMMEMQKIDVAKIEVARRG